MLSIFMAMRSWKKTERQQFFTESDKVRKKEIKKMLSEEERNLNGILLRLSADFIEKQRTDLKSMLQTFDQKSNDTSLYLNLFERQAKRAENWN
ncbi:hypothetical protein AVEN_71385-1 [Araneus ventricosus]|uniref:Uncharacterized protein n=1 Tax=Araneus ventricosus TaxID=182803 RepID=A0A4Y2BKH7_ARAVE|nr:hypothetical protein AVEN_71385-1 [Araneus ventricosus]